MNANSYEYKYRYARRLVAVVVLVLACSVAHTNCVKPINPETTELGNNDQSGQTASVVATTIQRCVDEKTMNNKTFKKRLDKLYKDDIKQTMKNTIDEYMIRVKSIEKLYDDDVKILKRMSGNDNKKTKNKKGKK